MAPDLQHIKTIFLEAADLPAGDTRESYLEQACAGDAELRRRIEALLNVHAQEDRLLDQPASVVVGGLSSSVAGEIESAGPVDFAIDFLEPASDGKFLGKLAHYDIVEVIGQGGMSVVFRAFDEKLRRTVAIKALAPHLSSSGAARSRFVREARAAAAVTHENVIAIHAVEESGPVPYLVMQYVQGRTLQDKLDAVGPLPVDEIVRIGLQVSHGLAAAHRQGLTHRDIKPANILLEADDERVRITDFGLARAADDASLTRSGHIAGTPLYMSPEQAEGDPLDARSDLFSLGSVLYALCTGHPPFRASTPLAVLKRVSEDEPRSISEINPNIATWLESIIAKLHAKDPNQRFASAAELARLFEQCLAQIHAGQVPRDLPRPAVASKSTFENKWMRAAFVTVALLAVVVAGAGVLSRVLPTEHPAQPVMASSPESAWTPPPVPTPEELARRKSPLDDWAPDAVTERLWGRGAGESTLPPGIVGVLADRRFVLPTNGPFHWLSLSPDGRRLAVPMDTDIALFDAQTGILLHRLQGHSERAFRGSFAHDSALFACGSQNGEVRIWNCESGKVEATLARNRGDLWSVLFTADDRHLVTMGVQGVVELFPVAVRGNSDETPLVLAQIEDSCEQLAFSSDHRRLAAVCSSGTVRVWDWPEMEIRTVLTELDSRSRSIAFSTDGAFLAAGSEDKVVVWRTSDWRVERSFKTGGGGGLGFSRDAQLLVTIPHHVRGDNQPAATWWRIDDGTQVAQRRIADVKNGDLFACVKPEGDEVLAIASESTLHTVESVSLDQSAEKKKSARHDEMVLTVACSPDGRWIASGDTGRNAFLWDLEDPRTFGSGAPTHTLSGHEGEVWCTQFTPDSTRVATACNDGIVRIWTVADGKLERELAGHSTYPALMAFSGDGRLLAAGGHTGEVNVWDVESGQPGVPIRWHVGSVRSVAFSPDGRWLASGGEDKTVQLVELSSGRRIRSFRGQKQFTGLAFSPDSSHLFAVSDFPGPTLRVWEIGTWTEQKVDAHQGHSLGLAIDPTGRFFATAGWDNRVDVWKWGSPVERLGQIALPSPCGLAYSPEGRHVVVGTRLGMVVVLRPSEMQLRTVDDRPVLPQ